MTLLAWLGALGIGLSLGLLGAGGSILTVPVLVYLVGEPAKAAVAESLAIVGAIAAVGALPYTRKRLVSWPTVLLFSAPGMMGSYVGAAAGKFVSGTVQLTAFSALMLVAALFMMRTPATSGASASASASPSAPPSRSPSTSPSASAAPSASAKAAQATRAKTRTAAFVNGVVIGIEGFAIGVVTGFMGIGGGFLIVPALVLFVGLPMHLAIGTSLATIALNSGIGFYKSAQMLPLLHLRLNGLVIVSFIGIGAAGSLIGGAICHRLPQQRLRRLFAWFVLLMGAWLLWRNLAGT